MLQQHAALARQLAPAWRQLAPATVAGLHSASAALQEAAVQTAPERMSEVAEVVKEVMGEGSPVVPQVTPLPPSQLDFSDPKAAFKVRRCGVLGAAAFAALPALAEAWLEDGWGARWPRCQLSAHLPLPHHSAPASLSLRITLTHKLQAKSTLDIMRSLLVFSCCKIRPLVVSSCRRIGAFSDCGQQLTRPARIAAAAVQPFVHARFVCAAPVREAGVHVTCAQVAAGAVTFADVAAGTLPRLLRLLQGLRPSAHLPTIPHPSPLPRCPQAHADSVLAWSKKVFGSTLTNAVIRHTFYKQVGSAGRE